VQSEQHAELVKRETSLMPLLLKMLAALMDGT
jgi:hypothetical protein